MPTVAQLVKEASKLKVKEVPSHVQKFATQHWTPGQLQGRFMNWLQNYKVQVRAGRMGRPGGARRVGHGAGRAAVAAAGFLTERNSRHHCSGLLAAHTADAIGISCLPAHARR